MIKRGTKIKDLQTGEIRVVIAHFNNLVGTVIPSKFEDHAWESEKDIKIFFDYREFYTWEVAE